MAFAKPAKPAKIRGCNAVATISTFEDAVDAHGYAVPGLVATKTDVPVKFDTVSPSEAFRMGHDVDETVFRVLLPIKYQGGGDITLGHTQRMTIDGVDYTISGGGQRQGRSGYQTATLKQVKK